MNLTFLLNTKQKHQVFSKALKYLTIVKLMSLSFPIIRVLITVDCFCYLWPWAVSNSKSQMFPPCLHALGRAAGENNIKWSVSLHINKPSIRLWLQRRNQPDSICCGLLNMFSAAGQTQTVAARVFERVLLHYFIWKSAFKEHICRTIFSPLHF